MAVKGDAIRGVYCKMWLIRVVVGVGCFLFNLSIPSEASAAQLQPVHMVSE